MKFGPNVQRIFGSLKNHLGEILKCSLALYWPYQTFKTPPQLILDILYFSLHPIARIWNFGSPSVFSEFVRLFNHQVKPGPRKFFITSIVFFNEMDNYIPEVLYLLQIFTLQHKTVCFHERSCIMNLELNQFKGLLFIKTLLKMDRNLFFV